VLASITKKGEIEREIGSNLFLSTDSLSNVHFGGWGYKYPQPPHFKASKFLAIAFNTRSLYFTPRHKQDIKSSPSPKLIPKT
jgi:hypothetical protein